MSKTISKLMLGVALSFFVMAALGQILFGFQDDTRFNSGGMLASIALTYGFYLSYRAVSAGLQSRVKYVLSYLAPFFVTASGVVFFILPFAGEVSPRLTLVFFGIGLVVVLSGVYVIREIRRQRTIAMNQHQSQNDKHAGPVERL